MRAVLLLLRCRMTLNCMNWGAQACIPEGGVSASRSARDDTKSTDLADDILESIER